MRVKQVYAYHNQLSHSFRQEFEELSDWEKSPLEITASNLESKFAMSENWSKYKFNSLEKHDFINFMIKMISYALSFFTIRLCIES